MKTSRTALQRKFVNHDTMVMRRAVWCVALLRLLLLPVSAGAVRIKACGTGSVTLEENHTPAYFTCDGFNDIDTVTWTVRNKNTSRDTVITCLPLHTTCHDDPDLSVTRNGSKSSLVIRGNYRAREGNNSIICSAANEKASCTLNVIAPATLSDCEVKPNADNSYWTVAGSCRFKAAYSTNGVYTCTWQEEVDGQLSRTINGKVEKRQTTGNKQYYDGTCSFTAQLSPQQREGRYKYIVNFFPGPNNKPAGGSFEMRSPGDPVTNCPQYVYEGQSVSCECLVNPSSPGVPPATAHWQDKSPGQPLVISDVTRNHSGQAYTCAVTWGPANDSVQIQEEYELLVAYPPSSTPVLSGYENGSVLIAGDSVILTCNVTGGHPLVTSVNVSCGGDVHGETSSVTTVNTSVSVTYTIRSVEVRHDGTECVCMGDWEVQRDAYNLSACVQLKVAQNVETFPWGIVAGAAGGGLSVVIIVAVVVVASRRQQARNNDNIFEENEAEGAYDRLRQSRIGLYSIYSAINHAVDTSETDNEGEGVYDKLRQGEIGSRSTYCVIHVGDTTPQPGNGEDC